MLTFHTADTQLRHPRSELHGGQLVTPFECPERVEIILARIRAAALGEVRDPERRGLAGVLEIHDAAYVEFLENLWDNWQAEGHGGEPIPSIWPARTLRGDRIPDNLEGRLGYYALAAETSVCAGTFRAALASKDIALAATDQVLAHGGGAFGLCRPPGHHAARDQFGGYCFFNNAAIAAQHARDHGVARVAILDVDFHHGNGTQEIFYTRDDVLFASIHGDPALEFPYYLGYADETGSGRGAGFTLNYPLPPGTGYPRWRQALEDALARIQTFGAELLIVSLGVDTFAQDPISSFTLESDDFSDYGGLLKRTGLPTVFLLEGGYAVEEIGVNVVNVLSGFDAG
ncbi:histone deacetylase family protein [Salinicola endophyticus]|uniref:Histone deacetylase family protein n=1 Tax=Salinicola endophyticus TaxID=1949083 RepID=A0ABY8FH68_9GAMM|nr:MULTISPECIES: histone deacetylase family protein [Salinicola]WFF42164.1 histone deacetylase family protein [Salinicola endophyticus]